MGRSNGSEWFFVGLGTRKRLERRCVSNRGSVWPPQHSGLMSRLSTPCSTPSSEHREGSWGSPVHLAHLLTHPRLVGFMNLKRGWLFVHPCFLFVSHSMIGKTVTWSLHLATLLSFSLLSTPKAMALKEWWRFFSDVIWGSWLYALHPWQNLRLWEAQWPWQGQSFCQM